MNRSYSKTPIDYSSIYYFSAAVLSLTVLLARNGILRVLECRACSVSERKSPISGNRAEPGERTAGGPPRHCEVGDLHCVTLRERARRGDFLPVSRDPSGYRIPLRVDLLDVRGTMAGIGTTSRETTEVTFFPSGGDASRGVARRYHN